MFATREESDMPTDESPMFLTKSMKKRLKKNIKKDQNVKDLDFEYEFEFPACQTPSTDSPGSAAMLFYKEELENARAEILQARLHAVDTKNLAVAAHTRLDVLETRVEVLEAACTSLKA